jgi:UPF0755 protein
LKAFKWFTIIFVAVLLAASAGSGIALWRYANTPGSSLNRQVIFAIAPGEAFDSLISRLQADGLIRAPYKFRLWARLKGVDKKLKAGEFYLSASMTPDEILGALVEGKAHLYPLTIPEGFNLKQIAAEVAGRGLGDSRAFLELANDPKTASKYVMGARSLEGYLFPDTYMFPKGVTAETIIDMMVQRFKEQFQASWRARAEELHMSVHEVVTLASIIEKETGDPAERPLISSVFHNRLRKKMRLESDPTVIYGIKDFDGNIKRRHLRARTPYNTYVIKGLPPGPIASPGRAAIKAALYPADTSFLFFVSKKDRTHHFSTNIRDHNRAVRKYQLRRRSRPKS